MKTELDYVSGSTIIPEGSFGISPSSVAKFFSSPTDWYQEYFNNIKSFSGSTATVLGTIVHYHAEKHVLRQQVDIMEVYRYIYNHYYTGLSDLPSDPEYAYDFIINNCSREIDVEFILNQYEIMSATLIQSLPSGKLTTEEMVAAEVQPDVWASGSIDLQTESDIYDYKTTSSLSAPTKMSYEHKLQLLTYAWIQRQRGRDIKRINIIYVTTHEVNRGLGKNGKPLADYPSSTSLITHVITEDDMDFISNVLNLIAETVKFVQENPDKAYIVFKDYRLKHQLPKPIITF